MVIETRGDGGGVQRKRTEEANSRERESGRAKMHRGEKGGRRRKEDTAQSFEK